MRVLRSDWDSHHHHCPQCAWPEAGPGVRADKQDKAVLSKTHGQQGGQHGHHHHHGAGNHVPRPSRDPARRGRLGVHGVAVFLFHNAQYHRVWGYNHR